MQTRKTKCIRIGMLIGSYQTGGAELQLIQLIERMDRKRFTPVALTIKAPGPLSGRLIDQNIEVISLNIVRKSVISSLLNAVRQLRALKLDILYCVLVDTVIIGSIIGKLAGVRHIIGGLRGLGMTWNRRRIWGVRITKWLIDSYIVNSNAIKQVRVSREHIEPEIIEIIPNGLELSLFPYTPEKDDIVGIVGSLKKIKGQDQFIDAAQILVDRGLEWTFMLIGDGPDREALEERVRRQKLQDSVVFLGSITNVVDYVRRFKVLVSASAFEGMSNSVLEAFSTGTPVVASNVPSNNEIITDKVNGLLYEHGNVQELASKIILLSKSPNMYKAMQLNARKTVERDYEISGMITRMENHFEKTLCHDHAN